MCGRHLRVRGTDRVMQLVYPCRHDSRRFVAGIRRRGDGMWMQLDTRTLIGSLLIAMGGIIVVARQDKAAAVPAPTTPT